MATNPYIHIIYLLYIHLCVCACVNMYIDVNIDMYTDLSCVFRLSNNGENSANGPANIDG